MRDGGKLRTSIGALAEAFRSPDLRRVEIAWALSVTADWIAIIVLAVFAFDAGGPLAVGLLGLIRMVPAALAAPFFAMPADRYPRQRVMAVVEGARALLIVSAGVAAWLSLPVAVIYALVMVAAVVSSALRSTQYALLPSLARSPHELVAANVGLATIEGLGMLAGPVLAGLFLALAGTGTLLVAAGAAFGVAALVLLGVESAGFALPQPTGRRRPIEEALAGFRTLATMPKPRLVVELFSAQTIVRGLLGVLLVIASFDLLGMGESGLGYLSAAIGAGGMIGVFVTLSLVGRPHMAVPFGLALLAWGVPIALIPVLPFPLMALVLMAVVGVGNSVGDVAGMTTLQRIVPDVVLARVLGVLDGLVLGAVGLGGILAPGLVAWLGPRGAFYATGALLPALVAVTWPALRKLDRDTVVPERELALLRSIAIFAPLDIPTVDHLAQQLHPRMVAAGATIMTQGDVGDRFYIIDRGAVEVSADGRHVADLGPGDFFGEIALLRDVPRTATVTATQETRLLSLERDQFLTAVTGFAYSHLEVDRITVQRLNDLERGNG
ncbi:MAG: MFS transporter [Actinomycetota bacterium]